jgi:outer membrane biogenesis lipoprotein LolB
MRRLTALLLAALAALLTACGGGGDDEPDVNTPRVDCAKEPEKCK